MAGHSRYSVSKKTAGLDGDILKNKLGIKDQQTLDDTETLLLSDTYNNFFEIAENKGVVFNVSFLFEIHKYFLETLYSWAGKIRKVDISKGDTLFAPVAHLEKSIKQLDHDLKNHLPSKSDSKSETATKLAFIHNELNVLHPFREGNGRTIRLFLDLIAHSIGYEFINWDKTKRKEYIEACAEGVACRHDSMKKIIYRGLKRSE